MEKKDLNEIFIQLKEVSTRWYNLGLSLGVLSDTLDIIEANKKSEGCEVCLRQLLAHCLESERPLTWSDVCKALRSESVNRHDTAKKIEEGNV